MTQGSTRWQGACTHTRSCAAWPARQTSMNCRSALRGPLLAVHTRGEGGGRTHALQHKHETPGTPTHLRVDKAVECEADRHGSLVHSIRNGCGLIIRAVKGRHHLPTFRLFPELGQTLLENS